MRYSFLDIESAPTGLPAQLTVLVDILNGYINGDLDYDVFQAHERVQEDGMDTLPNFLMANLTIDTDVFPSNGATNYRFIYESTQNDKAINFPLEAKAKQGNMIIIAKFLTTSNSVTTNAEHFNERAQLESVLDDISDDWSVSFFSSLGVATSTEGSAEIGSIRQSMTNDMVYFGIGTLKDTQTDNYNPLDAIPEGYIYKMTDVIKAEQKAVAVEAVAEATK